MSDDGPDLFWVWTVFVLICGVGIGGALFGLDGLGVGSAVGIHYATSTTATTTTIAPTQTDYFNMTCQQLHDLINKDVGTFYPLGGWQNGNVWQEQGFNLLQIYQIKGCPP